MNNKNAPPPKRQRSTTFRTVLLTSLVWALLDVFLIYYLIDSGGSLVSVNDPLTSDYKVQHLQTQLLQLQKEHAKLVKRMGEPDPNDEVGVREREQKFNKPGKVKAAAKADLLVDDDNLESAPFIQGDVKDWWREDTSDQPKNPSSWHGEEGRGVVVPEKLKKEAKRRFKENEFNIVASDLIALNRSVPDQRSETCKQRKYPVDLPTTSIIIVHHNEGNTTLLRGLVSIVRKSPARYLKEIILVDDASEGREYLGKPLDDFVKTLPIRVKVLRNKKRIGLMKSRLVGAEVATADTMTFLDAHIEATDGWLPPLLYEIKKNRKAVVSPIIDVIKYDDFSYLQGSETTYGGFSNKMIFDWIPMPEREHRRRGGDKSLPARTPAMAGGLFTIDRDYFYEMGTYDSGMDIWGFENIEMSFRMWMCGGTLLILPCSHVGHVFRLHTPYSFPGGTNNVIFKNNRRVVDVWTDEYASYFHKTITELGTVEAGDISERVQLREKLNCKSFKWYLDNIYLEAPLPKDFFHVGAISNVGLNFCLDTMGRKEGGDAGASFCHGQGGNQIFEYSKTHNLVAGNICLDSVGSAGVVKMKTCNRNKKSQQWEFDHSSQIFRNRHTFTCLTIHDTQNNILVTKNCDTTNPQHKWTFEDPVLYADSESA